MPTYRLTLEYDGAAYAGWQRQPNVSTVEGALRDAITGVTGEQEFRLTAASRTDAGAHSHGQVTGLTLAREWEPARLLAALNGTLPSDIAVVGAEITGEAFHARFDALGRRYRYVVVPRRMRAPATRHHAWFVKGDLDLAAMRGATRILVGDHDFAAFGKPTNPGTTTRRRVSNVAVRRVAVHNDDSQAGLTALVIDVSANAFLYGMMRTIAGALVAVGQGKLTHSDIAAMIRDPHGAHRHVTVAPAHGLHQWTVTYP